MTEGIVLLIIQIAFAVHVVKTGKPVFWIFIVLFIPGIGCLIYFITQILPELGQSQTARKAGNTLLKTVDPERELRRREEELQLADTTENRIKLAEECLEAEFFDKAAALLQECLKGANEHDPYILLLLAQAQFGAEKYADSKQTLERLIEHNPSFKSPEGHLLYARSLEALKLPEQAMSEYKVVVISFPGEEARARYGLFLLDQGKKEEANEVFRESLTRSKRAPKYYRKKEKKWLKIAEHNISN